MRNKSRQLYFSIICWLLFIFSNNVQALAQDEDSVASIIEAPVADSSYFDEYDDDADVESNESLERRLKANAFDRIDTIAQNPINFRELNKSYLQKLKDDPSFDYVKNGIPEEKASKKTRNSSINLNQVLLAIAIVAFLAILIWYLSENDIFLFRKKPTSNATSFSGDEDENIFSLNYNEAIQKAVADKNFRLAIRLQYLQVLKMLADKGIINYLPDKTNFEYLMQLRPTNYYNEFFTLTRNYEYSWYGLFNIDEAKYDYIKNSFIDFNNKIR